MGWREQFTRPSPERFGRMVVAALERNGAPPPVVFDRAAFVVRVGTGEDRYVLHNAYRDYCDAPRRRRPQVLKAYFGGGHDLRLPERYEDARKDLLPRVRERFVAEVERLSDAADGTTTPASPSVPLSDEYFIVVVWDQPMALMTLPAKTLAQWGVTLEQALEVARENLRSRSEPDFRSLAPGLFRSDWRDGHDASRILLVEQIARLPVSGDPVAFIPHRDCLLVAGSDDPGALAAAAAVAEEALRGPRPMSGVPLRLVGGEWRVFAPEEAGRAEVAVRNLLLTSRAQEYAEQKKLLDRADERAGRDVYHARYTLVEEKDGSLFSCCAWFPGEEATLPEADVIFFMDEHEPPGSRVLGRATARRVREVMGAAVRRLDHHPPRWAVHGFPSDEELEAMIDRGVG